METVVSEAEVHTQSEDDDMSEIYMNADEITENDDRRSLIIYQMIKLSKITGKILPRSWPAKMRMLPSGTK